MHTEDFVKRPDLYDLLYSEYKEDISMYTILSENHSEILECGIGTGRIAIELAERGKNIYGIDISPEMLQALCAKLNQLPQDIKSRISTSYADMRNFNLERKFSCIFVPFGAFNYLLSIDDQKACLLAIKKHILEQGILVLELLSFSLVSDRLNNNNCVHKVFRKVDLETGNFTEMWRFSRFDSATQIIEQDRHFRFYNTNGYLEDEVTVLWKNRFVLLGEIILLLEVCGFIIENIYGDHNLGVYNHNSKFMLIKAKLKS